MITYPVGVTHRDLTRLTPAATGWLVQIGGRILSLATWPPIAFAAA